MWRIITLPQPRSWSSYCVNLPNSITLTRIAAIPLLIWILCTPRFAGRRTGEREILASADFHSGPIHPDGIDGYLARKRGQISPPWACCLIPLADKLLIAAAFITLVQFNPLVPAWMAVVIIGREFLVNGLRSIAASEVLRFKQASWEVPDAGTDHFRGGGNSRPALARVAGVWRLHFPVYWIWRGSPFGSWFCFRWSPRSTISSPSGRGLTAHRKSDGASRSSNRRSKRDI